MRDAILFFNWAVFGYFILFNGILLATMLIGARVTTRSRRDLRPDAYDDIFANPLTPGVSILVPAYNEEKSILDCVHSLLSTRYPNIEVIVADDGSTDDTFVVLREKYELNEVVVRPTADVRIAGNVETVWRSESDPRLTVVRKQNASRRSDALNAALAYATCPLVATIDADSVLADDAMLRIVRPFIDDPDRVVACGGIIQAANGATMRAGHVLERAYPTRLIERIQVVEYLRTFVLARCGWARMRSLLLISGAFGVFRRDVLLDVGGFDNESLAEDLDLVIRIHRHLRDAEVDYKVAFTSDPVCWTEVPGTRESLARQRLRWSQGLAETMWKHRAMMLRPRYGRVGMVALPYYAAFELMSPVVEILGLAALIIGLHLGIVNVPFAILFFLASIGFSFTLSMLALLVDRRMLRSYSDVSGRPALGATLVESLVFRWSHAWWRLRGLGYTLVKRRSGWGELQRQGFVGLETAERR